MDHRIDANPADPYAELQMLNVPWHTLKVDHPRLTARPSVIPFFDPHSPSELRQASLALVERARAVSCADLLVPSGFRAGYASRKSASIRNIPLSQIAKSMVSRVRLLGIAWELTGDPAFAERAKAEILGICSLPDWTPQVFLATARIAYAVAIAYDLIYSALDNEEKEHIAESLLWMAIDPGFHQINSSVYWATTPHNWTLVCNSGLMVAALAIADVDRRRTAAIFERCYQSAKIGLRGYAPDGAWAEGPGYWSC